MIKVWEKIKYLIISMRPKQWIKNSFVFAGLIFSKSFINPSDVLLACLSFLLFSMVSGASYIINDIVDRENDMHHPQKAERPIAKGKITVGEGLVSAVLLTAGALLISWFANRLFFLAIGGYFFLVLLYTLKLKHVIILDVIVISSGFVIRTIAGALIIQVTISSWLIMCMIFLSLFMVLNKRKAEMELLSENAPNHRKNLGEYSPELINQMLPVATSASIISYSLYTFTSDKSRYMAFTIPFVIYGIFRYQHIALSSKEETNPENLLIKDIPLIINVILWAVISIIIVFFYY